MKYQLIITVLVVGFLACSKSDNTTPTPTTPVAIKCSKSTILDTLLSGRQSYILISWGSEVALLDLKDSKGKARAWALGALFEFSVSITAKSITQVDVSGSGAKRIQGNTSVLYAPDTFIFKDDNCKITTTQADGRGTLITPATYTDITNSRDLLAILIRYEW